MNKLAISFFLFFCFSLSLSAQTIGEPTPILTAKQSNYKADSKIEHQKDKAAMDVAETRSKKHKNKRSSTKKKHKKRSKK